MNPTEPHCGTDLGLLRTKAVKQADGSYKITGTKIFISSGEHDLAENIIHLVLARIEGAPAGIKGVSLFVVPKFLVNADGSLGQRNGVSCGSIEHKMGIHGNSTCVMNYDNATGWLIGEENKGMQGMFVMMNEARLGVAVQGMAQFVRDARIAMIYEGANGIQALDLVGRKLPRDGGRAVMAFFSEVASFAKEHGGDEAMKPYVTPLSTALGHLQQATGWLMQNALTKPDNAGAAATDYMQLFGLVAFAYMWARMAKVVQDKIAASGATPYLSTKLVTGRFFMERMLPETHVHLARIQTGCATTMELAAEAF